MHQDESLWEVERQGGMLRGSFRDLSFPELLVSLHENRATGILSVTRDRVTKQIFLRDGVPCAARSNLRSEHLGEFLVSRGFLTPAEHEAARAAREAKEIPLAAALQQEGMIEPAQLFLYSRRLFLTILYSLFGLSDGTYTFAQTRVPRRFYCFRVAFSHLLTFGVRQIWDPEVLAWMAGDPASLVEPTARFSECRSIRFSSKERMVVEGFGQGRTIAQIVESLEIEEPLVLKTLLILRYHGCLTFRKIPAGEQGREVVDLDSSEAASLGFQPYRPGTPEEEGTVAGETFLVPPQDSRPEAAPVPGAEPRFPAPQGAEMGRWPGILLQDVQPLEAEKGEGPAAEAPRTKAPTSSPESQARSPRPKKTLEAEEPSRAPAPRVSRAPVFVLLVLVILGLVSAGVLIMGRAGGGDARQGFERALQALQERFLGGPGPEARVAQENPESQGPGPEIQEQETPLQKPARELPEPTVQIQEPGEEAPEQAGPPPMETAGPGPRTELPVREEEIPVLPGPEPSGPRDTETAGTLPADGAPGVQGAQESPSRVASPQGPVRLQGIHYSREADYVRVVVDLNGPVRFQTHALPTRKMVFLTLENTRLSPDLDRTPLVVPGRFLKAIRVGQYRADKARVVLDFREVTEVSAFALSGPDRVVLLVSNGPAPGD